MIQITLATKELLWWYGPSIFSALSYTSLIYFADSSLRPLELLAVTWLGGKWPYFSVPMSAAVFLYCALSRRKRIILVTSEPARS